MTWGRKTGTVTAQGHATVEATRGRLSRRQFLSTVCTVAGAASVGLWPGASTGQAPTVIKATPTLVVAFSLDPGHLDPRAEAGVPGSSMMYPHMYETLVWRRKDTSPDPALGLAESWEYLTPTTLRFRLRQGVKFHNGDDCDAEAIKVSAASYAAPESRSSLKSSLAVVREVKVVDKYTVDYITAVPNRPLLRALSSQTTLSPRALQELGPKIATNPVGTGPYKFVEYVPGQHLLMEMNPNYWGPKPKSQRLKIRFLPENGTRVAALESDEVMMITNVPPDTIKRLQSNPQLEMRTAVTNRIMLVNLRTDRPPWHDKRARQALNYAIDKEAITEGILGGLAPIARAPLAPALLGSHMGLQPYPYDPEKAKKLLAAAGATGATFHLGVPYGRYLLDKQIGEAIAGYLSDIGLQVIFDNPVWSAFVTEIAKYDKAKYDGYFYGWGVTTGEPDTQMREHYHSKFSRRSAYKNPEVDRLVDEAAESFDEGQVKAAYFKAQEIVWDECPWIFLHMQPDLNAVNKRLQGFEARLDEWLILTEAALV
jgi:peptide/nickel transport system substrate-binding protein